MILSMLGVIVNSTPSNGTPHAGDYSTEDATNYDTEKFDRRKIRVVCPTCKRKSALLCSPLTTEIHSDWRWVGCDHKEPYTIFRSKCRCGQNLEFTIYTPQ